MTARKHLAPRHELAANLAALLKHSEMSSPTLAKKAGVDRKSVNNMLNARFDSRYENVDKVGRVFGFTGWQMLRPIDPEKIKEIPKASEIEALIAHFYDADVEQRKTIMGVAEMTGEYRKKKP